MTGQELITLIRKDRQELWDSHLLFLKTEGKQGVQCLTPEKMQVLLHESDLEIIKKGILNGVYISDIDLYKEKIKDE